ncbi:hypothetical protein TI05_10855 [Achromatium sp. WMS3]|nr:hypothetical protein TI05_10855 [Achromatium sp. WMS3]
MQIDLELQLLQEIEELKSKIQLLEGKTTVQIPIYQYSRIRERELNALFNIEKKLDEQRFDTWFHTNIDILPDDQNFFQELLAHNRLLMDSYDEEDLKTHVIVPILNKVQFISVEKNIRDFYELAMTYTTDRFILNGCVDFVVAEGLVKSSKPYFFIQEFKRSEEYGNPRPQLLAELISALELNTWQTIKGAYIIGSLWRFVIVEKLPDAHYQYFVSQNFDATKLDDLLLIYKHLLAIKHEIFSMLDTKT